MPAHAIVADRSKPVTPTANHKARQVDDLRSRKMGRAYGTLTAIVKFPFVRGEDRA